MSQIRFYLNLDCTNLCCKIDIKCLYKFAYVVFIGRESAILQ